MKRFKNILLVLRDDHNNSGIERAVALAQKNDAKLTLIQAPGQFIAHLIRAVDVHIFMCHVEISA